MVQLRPLVLVLLVLAAEAKEKKAAASKEKPAEGCPCSAEVEARLEKALKTIQTLQAEKESSARSKTDVPFLNLAHIRDAFSKLAKVEQLNGMIIPFVDKVRARVSSAMPELSKVASTVYDNCADLGTDALITVQDLHNVHVRPHTKAYEDAAVGLYKENAEAHVEMLRSVYNEAVHPHVSTAIDAASGLAGPLSDGLLTHAASVAKIVRQKSIEGVQGDTGGLLASFTQPMEKEIMGRHIRFEHGWFDIVLAVVQACIAGFVILVVVLLMLRIILWKIGFKFVGGKIVGNLLKLTWRIFFRLLKLVRSPLAWAIWFFLLFVWCMLGIFAMHMAEQQGKIGLNHRMILGIGFVVGLVLFLCFRLLMRCCCGRPKGKADSARAATKAAAKPAAAKSEPKAKAPPKGTRK